ncbi:MAG: hypothetical protein NW214_05895 [Pseudanabaenaceae cyanobacterium bins.39]|nr:hypothetical protein [Pseudanabaenaceae cyanobacterium bins.39]
MSQTRFGDSSSQEQAVLGNSMPEPESNLSDAMFTNDGYPNSHENLSQEPFSHLSRQMLEQELRFCNERSQQAQLLLRQAQEQLQLSQMVIQRQETLTQTLQSRIDQLERELQDVHSNCDELRERLKRQQHHTSQLKAALERCLDTSSQSTSVPPSPTESALSALESWSVAKLADEKITPIESNGNDPDSQNILQNVIKITAPPDVHSGNQSQPDPSPPAPIDISASTPRIHTESSEIPDALSRNQPISPLIIRPHKAHQGSPLSINLPKLRSETSAQSLEQLTSNDVDEEHNLSNQNFSHQHHQPVSTSPRSETPVIDHDVLNSSLSNARPTLLHRVATPKFIQALSNGESEMPPQDKEDTENLPQLAIASSRKPTSMASVQLPQFPPLPRR